MEEEEIQLTEQPGQELRKWCVEQVCKSKLHKTAQLDYDKNTRITLAYEALMLNKFIVYGVVDF
jgi:hypothetical protein